MPDADVIPQSDLGILGLSHIIVEVTDPDETAAFYQDVLGLEGGPIDPWPLSGTSRVLTAGRGQYLILAAAAEHRDLRETGVHHAFAVGVDGRARAAAALESLGVEVFTYVEDPPEESSGGFYFFDPDGNRIQLVTQPDRDAGGPPDLHHTAIQVADILWAERFYTEVLGLKAVHRVGWNTADYARAKAWAEGKEDMAPGTRRMDERYSVIVDKQVMPRVNMQVYLAAGANVLGIYLADRHMQEPPEELCAGTPRTAFAIDGGGLDRAAARLGDVGWNFEGPVSHGPGLPIAGSIYLRDPGGNFVELAVPRDTT